MILQIRYYDVTVQIELLPNEKIKINADGTIENLTYLGRVSDKF